MKIETRLEDDHFELEKGEAASHMGVLHIRIDEIGEIALSPRAQYQLLEWLYERRAQLYRANHLDIGGKSFAPPWIQDALDALKPTVDGTIQEQE